MKSEIFKIVFEDSALLVIEKKVPFLSQQSDHGQTEGLFEFVSRALEIPLLPVHRLDREVLGLMVIAKNKAVAEKLSQQFRDREVIKTYEAEVAGRVFKDEESLVHYLKKNEKTNHVTVFPKPTMGAKRAELIYKVVERKLHSTRVRIDLKTGRSHQIRAQLAKIGHPILGDSRYTKKTSEADIPLDRIQLKSVRLGFTHPVTKDFVDFQIR